MKTLTDYHAHGIVVLLFEAAKPGNYYSINLNMRSYSLQVRF